MLIGLFSKRNADPEENHTQDFEFLALVDARF